MKKIWILIIAVALSIGLTACGDKEAAGNKTEEQEVEIFTYDGETNIEIGDSSFTLEKVPENAAEDTVVKALMYDITGEVDKEYENIADIELTSIDQLKENKIRAEEQGIYVKSYVVHNVNTLEKNKYTDEMEEFYYFDGWKNIAEQYALTEFKIINIEYTKNYTKLAKKRELYDRNGRYNRNVMVGKTAEDDKYKIYAYSVEIEIKNEE